MNRNKRSAVTELRAFYVNKDKTEKQYVDGRGFYSLTYRFKGEILVETDDVSLFSPKGSVTFIPKGMPYSTEILDSISMAVIHFDLDKDIYFRNPSVINVENIGIKLLFEKIVNSSHVDSPVDFRCMSAFYELLSRLEELPEGGNDLHPPEKIRLIRERMERGYADKSMCVSSLADEFGISTSYLRREFNCVYGISPIAFLRSVRVGNAENMLESGLLSVAEIAEQCGFSSVGYFIQVFHKIVGESPNKYRKNKRSN